MVGAVGCCGCGVVVELKRHLSGFFTNFTMTHWTLRMADEVKFKDEKGRWVKVGSRVRGKFQNFDLEVHGHVRKIYATTKYGMVCEIEEKQGNVQNIPASLVRRMYGDTQATKATKTVKKKKTAKKVKGKKS
jgi:hypothetical protein